MKRKLIAAVVFLGVLSVCAGLFFYHKPTERTVSGQAQYELSAVEIYNEFASDEAEATRKYLNSVVRIRGAVAEVNKADSAGFSVLLAANDSLFGVSCQFGRGVPMKKLTLGDTVSVKGLCTGKLMDVVLVRCALE